MASWVSFRVDGPDGYAELGRLLEQKGPDRAMSREWRGPREMVGWGWRRVRAKGGSARLLLSPFVPLPLHLAGSQLAVSTMAEAADPLDSLAMGSSDRSRVLSESWGTGGWLPWPGTLLRRGSRCRPKLRLLASYKGVGQTDYVAMRQSYAKLYGELEDKQIPSKEYLEKKLHELENGEFRAEALTEVVNRDEVDPAWDAKGYITVKRGNTAVAMQTGPEQLRMRLTVMANALIMMKMKHNARNELKYIIPYCSCLLREV